MVNRTIKVPMPDGTMKEAVEVKITKADEPWSEIELEDGTVLRSKNVVAAVHRVDGVFDQEGNPVYMIKATPAMTLVHVPEQLRKK